MKKPDWKIWIKNKKQCKTWLDSYIKRGVLKKADDDSNRYISKTNHNLNFANWIFDKHSNELLKDFPNERFYDWLITIYYYAMYHSALALISKKGFASKNHSATLCFLIYHYFHLQNSLNEEDLSILASSLSEEDIEIIGFSKELRERATYDVHESFEKELADKTRKEAITFINKIKSII